MSFLETQSCYSVLRASGKVVVFDTRIPIQLAFYALVEHGELIFMFMTILKYCERVGSIFICSGEGGWVVVTLLNNICPCSHKRSIFSPLSFYSPLTPPKNI